MRGRGRVRDREKREEREGGATMSFMKISEVIYHHFCLILLVTQTNPWRVPKGTQGFRYQEAGITGNNFVQ